MRLIPFIIFFLTTSLSFSAKKVPKQELIKVMAEINVENYVNASNKLNSLIRKYPEDPFLHLQQGICLLNIPHRSGESIAYFEYAKQHFSLDRKNNIDAIEAYFYLGQALHLNYRFEEALAIFKELKSKLSTKQKDVLEKVLTEIKYNENAISLKAKPVDFRITNLGQAINSDYDEHSPLISADESLLLFTSNRQGTGKDESKDDLFYEDIFESKWREGKWLPSMNSGSKINTLGNDATCSLSPDGQELIIYRNDGISGDLYYSKLGKKGWDSPEKLPKPINTTYQENHGSFANKNKTLVFSSDRPGGFGGTDLYIVHQLPNGEWGKIMNLGPAVNTPLDEESPFMHADNKTLYFASRGHSSMGGFDIFKTEFNDSNKWTPAQNIGYPINTPGDDLFYIPTIDDQRVYFASERSGGYGRSDIYLIEFPVSDDRTLAVVAGYLFLADGTPSALSKITIESSALQSDVSIYRPNPDTGKYLFILPTGLKYTMTIETVGYPSIKQEFEIKSRDDYNTLHNPIYLNPLIIQQTP